MFIVYHYNKFDSLKVLTSTLIAKQPLPDPFQQETIIVHSNTMAQWIQMELAVQSGISANINFPSLASFIWQMFTRIFTNIPDKNIFTKSVMTWRLMALLPRLCQYHDFTLISNYLHDDIDKRKCFQFAAKIADLFSQYLVYRPDWLESWQRCKLIDGIDKTTQRWQAKLWQALMMEMKLAGEPLCDHANLYQRFIDTLTESQTRPLGLPDRIFIYGISALPPIYLQVLQALGRHIDIHLMFINPCRYYWSDIRDHTFLSHLLHRHRQHYQHQTKQTLFRQSKYTDKLFNKLGEQQTSNPLLASWGKQGRDTLYLLSHMDSITEVDAFVEPIKNNLLSLVQHDILMLENHATINFNTKIPKHNNNKRMLRLDDRSLSLHVCHSPQREVEVLHDNIFKMISEDPTLRPRDIIVMAPNIDHYKPAIQAIFGNTSKDYNLPFAIIDQQVRYFHPVISTFLNLLELPHSRFSAEQILTLLEVPALAARFAIDEHGLQLLRQWVAESGIRWGLDDDTMRALMLPATGQHTWKFGLTRMLLGYAMESNSGDWQGMLPYEESNGLIAELVGQLAEFLMCLRQWRYRLSQPRPLDAWLSCAHEINKDFFMPDTKTAAALTMLENLWQQLLEHGLQVGYKEPVSVTLLQDKLTARLNQDRINQSLLTGAINFCTLTPIRSIPFRVVCLLGMNDGIYPRTSIPTKFDLMTQQPRRGDPNRRNDDRYLFLEILISTQQQLYISFIGRAIQDNTLRCPSILVSELIDYIAQSFYLPGDEHNDAESSAKRVRLHLWQWHTRMPFAPENFIPYSENQSFADEWLPAAKADGVSQSNFITPLAAIPCKELTLDELLYFYRHPVRAWFVQRLAVSFDQELTKLETDEPFVVDKLTSYRLNDRLVNALIYGENIDRLFNQIRAAGLLPYGAFGELYWNKQYQNMTELAQQIRIWQLPETHDIEINITLKDVTLSGLLPRVQKNGILRWRPGTLSAKDGLLLWMEHLVYCAMGGAGESRMFGLCNGWHFAPLPIAQAKTFLCSLISGYYHGMITPLFLLPRTGIAWLSHCYNSITHFIDRDTHVQQQARDKLLQAWHGNLHVPGEGKDPYLQRLVRQLDQQHIEAIILATERYFLPPFMFNLAQSTTACKMRKK